MSQRNCMRMSELFSQTLRDAPAEALTPGHRFLLRAGYIRQVSAGIFAFLPLAFRTFEKVKEIMREEMDAIGGQELLMPVALPADLWKESGRWFAVGAELARFKDRNERDMILAMTHEEAVSDLVRREIRSYKQLPRLVYHIQTKFRDDPRPRAGLVRVREFTMKDSYSLDANWEGLEKQYRAHYQAYFRIFQRCGLPSIAVGADTGMMGGKLAHEFMYLNPMGEDTLLLCDACGFSANRQVARFTKKAAHAHEAPRPAELVETPGTKTIDALARFLNIAADQTAKAVFFWADYADPAQPSQLVLGLVRGDMELNETKLLNAIQAKDIRPATEAEITACGIVPGFGSPVGSKGALVVVDDLLAQEHNLVGGANQPDRHYLNLNLGRDYQADLVTDIVAAQDGDACPNCGGALRSARGVEIGNIFQLGTRYSEALGCQYQDADGSSKPVVMGSYGIGLGRLIACVAEEHFDDYGLVWPVSLAPFQVHLIALKSRDENVRAAAERLYEQLGAAGVEVLFDDREDSPGVKFSDADLIGLPVRVTVSEKALAQGSLELKLRAQPEKRLIALDGAVNEILGVVAELKNALAAEVVGAVYPE